MTTKRTKSRKESGRQCASQLEGDEYSSVKNIKLSTGTAKLWSEYKSCTWWSKQFGE